MSNAIKPASYTAKLLKRLVLGDGFCAGKEFPCNTIRNGFSVLDKAGFLMPGTNTPTPEARAFVHEFYCEIPA